MFWRKPTDGELAARRTHFVQLGLDQFGAELGPAFRALAKCYIGRSGDVVAFLDWAVASRAPGVRDFAYFTCNSLPIEVRREHEHALLARYLEKLAAHGWALDEQTALDQYRIFSIYSWIAAVSTAAMGTQWQPVEVTRPAFAQHDGRDRGSRRRRPARRMPLSPTRPSLDQILTGF